MAPGNPIQSHFGEVVRRSAASLRSRLQRHWKSCVPGVRNRELARWEDGGATIEMAATLPILLTLLFCFMEVCLAFYSYQTIAESAREGTRYAMVRGASCPTSANPTCEVTAAQVNAYVSALGWPNIGGGTMTVATTYDSAEAVNSHVTVKVTYSFKITMPFVPNNSISMSSTSKKTIVQ